MKIFVSAYACEPDLGSEIGVGWHWVLEMSKYFELWVLTRESNRKNIEPWMKGHPAYAGIHWLYYDLPEWARWWKKGLRGVRTYYNIWQCLADGIVKKTMRENDIHVFHHLTYGNALWKVSSYGLSQTFIWGPIGGLETVPLEFTKHYALKGRIIEFARRLAVKLLPLNRAFHERCSRADLIFCKTEATLQQIPLIYRDKAMLMTDVAVEVDDDNNHDDDLNLNRDDKHTLSLGDNLNLNDNLNHSRYDKHIPCHVDGRDLNDTDGRSVRILTVGRLDAWRGFDLVIEAFALLAKRKENVELTIVGGGSDDGRLRTLISSTTCKGKIRMVGRVSQAEYMRLMRDCDMVVSGALKEGAVTVAFDAIANGKPQVCVETGGYTKTLVPEMSEVVQRECRKQVIEGLCHGMGRFCSQDERKKAKDCCRGLAEQLCWEAKGKHIGNIVVKNSRF